MPVFFVCAGLIGLLAAILTANISRLRRQKKINMGDGGDREMLAAGGRLRHRELLAPFGLDAADPDFWHRGMKTLEGFIDQLEQVA